MSEYFIDLKHHSWVVMSSLTSVSINFQTGLIDATEKEEKLVSNTEANKQYYHRITQKSHLYS